MYIYDSNKTNTSNAQALPFTYFFQYKKQKQNTAYTVGASECY